MENITNNINNVGKPLEDREFDFRFSYKELRILKGIFQNPHPNHEDSQELIKFSEEGFYNLNALFLYLHSLRGN